MIAVGILVVIVAGVFAIFMMMKKSEKKTTDTTEQVDPFADLPEDVPKGRKPKSSGSSGGADAPAVDPFADVPTPKEDPLWLNSLATANRGIMLIEEAVEARNAGDTADAKEKRAKAKGLLEEALDATREWAIELERVHGPEDRFVKLVNKRTARWRRELMALRKSGGM